MGEIFDGSIHHANHFDIFSLSLYLREQQKEREGEKERESG